MRTFSFKAGVNLGGWLSQFQKYSAKHFDTFITEVDIKRIADWGMDHIRLPIDYALLEDDNCLGVYKEEGYFYIDQCLDWCRTQGLGVILDLHRAPGYSFNTLDVNSLFSNPFIQERYVHLWESIVSRYRTLDDQLQVELLNEVVEPTSERWNRLAHKTIEAIRRIDPNRYIIFGGNHYNSIDQLSTIELVSNDDRIIYTFHFYKPHLFTHQGASWDKITREYQTSLYYPGDFREVEEYARMHPEYSSQLQDLPKYIDISYLHGLIQPAIDFTLQTGKPLYCGEYGVIDLAPLASRIAWHRDFVGILQELKIGRSCWSYKEMNFGLVNQNGIVVHEELVNIVSQR